MYTCIHLSDSVISNSQKVEQHTEANIYMESLVKGPFTIPDSA